jgi:hypothetical protein
MLINSCTFLGDPVIKRGRLRSHLPVLSCYIFVLVPSKDLDFQCHMAWSFMCSVKMRVDCSFVDIGGIDGLGCLLPLSTIFQLYCGSLFYWSRKSEYPEKTIDLLQVTDKLYHIMLYQVLSLLSLVVTIWLKITSKPNPTCIHAYLFVLNIHVQ